MVQIIMMVEQQSTKGKLSKQAEQLKAMMHDWIPKRKNSVHTLRVLADKLMEHHNKVCIANVAGSSFAVAGFVLYAVGFGLSFATFGTSLIISGIGLGVGAAGGVTSAGSMFVEDWIREDTFDAAQKILDNDRVAHEAIEKLYMEFGNEAQNSQIKNGLKAGLTSVFVVKSCVETGFKCGARIASTAVSEGGEALFRGLSVAGKVVHIGGFALSAVLLPVDIYTLVTNSMEIDASRKGQKRKPKAVKKLRELADELEKNMPNENDFIRELDDYISKAC
ncbi:uncharacterized protein LOC144633364 [Oculina patagonica]